MCPRRRPRLSGARCLLGLVRAGVNCAKGIAGLQYQKNCFFFLVDILAWGASYILYDQKRYEDENFHSYLPAFKDKVLFFRSKNLDPCLT